jgi:glucan endo-1,3-alpha-glucosidase
LTLLLKTRFRDALALNIGSDHWQPNQVQNAYNAAQQLGTGFKLFLSLDFTAMSCSLGDVVSRVNQVSHHPNQFKINGRVFVSSFSGGCLGDSGWASVKARTNAYIMPFIWGLEGQFHNWRSLDSWFWYATISPSFLFSSVPVTQAGVVHGPKGITRKPWVFSQSEQQRCS